MFKFNLIIITYFRLMKNAALDLFPEKYSVNNIVQIDYWNFFPVYTIKLQLRIISQIHFLLLILIQAS